MLFILSPKPNRASVRQYLLAAGRDPFGGSGPRGSSRSVWQSNHSPSDLFKRSPPLLIACYLIERPRKTPKERSDAYSPFARIFSHVFKATPDKGSKSNSEYAR